LDVSLCQRKTPVVFNITLRTDIYRIA